MSSRSQPPSPKGRSVVPALPSACALPGRPCPGARSSSASAQSRPSIAAAARGDQGVAEPGLWVQAGWGHLSSPITGLFQSVPAKSSGSLRVLALGRGSPSQEWLSRCRCAPPSPSEAPPTRREATPTPLPGDRVPRPAAVAPPPWISTAVVHPGGKLTGYIAWHLASHCLNKCFKKT